MIDKGLIRIVTFTVLYILVFFIIFQMTELEVRVCVPMEDSTFASDVKEIKEEKISELLRPSNIKQEKVQLQEKINLLEKKLLEVGL